MRLETEQSTSSLTQWVNNQCTQEQTNADSNGDLNNLEQHIESSSFKVTHGVHISRDLCAVLGDLVGHGDTSEQ